MRNALAVLTQRFLDALGALPIPVRIFIGRTLGALFSIFPTREREIAKLQMDLFLKKEGGSKHLSRVYQSLGQTILESLNLGPLFTGENRVVCKNLELARDILNSGKGMLALGAHTGNWDLMASFFVRQGFPVWTIGREARSPLFQKILSHLRAKYDIHTIWRHRGLELKTVMSCLKKGQVVAALIDQDTDVSGTPVSFFGQPAMVPDGLIRLAKKHSIQVVSAFVFRTSPGHYTIHVEEMPQNYSGEEMLIEYHKRLEALIREYPEQWVWFHKRWRTLPSGERLSSKDYITRLKELLRAPAAALILLGTLFLSSCSSGDYGYLSEADHLARAKHYDAAVEAYRKHISRRLEIIDRPKWENPYFHLLTIGDIQLEQGKVSDAIKTYEEAEKNGVDKSLVSDRYRFVAAWYESHHRIDEGMKFLEKYRDRDPLLMDMMLDRLSKEFINHEPIPESEHSPSEPDGVPN